MLADQRRTEEEEQEGRRKWVRMGLGRMVHLLLFTPIHYSLADAIHNSIFSTYFGKKCIIRCFITATHHSRLLFLTPYMMLIGIAWTLRLHRCPLSVSTAT